MPCGSSRVVERVPSFVLKGSGLWVVGFEALGFRV